MMTTIIIGTFVLLVLGILAYTLLREKGKYIEKSSVFIAKGAVFALVTEVIILGIQKIIPWIWGWNTSEATKISAIIVPICIGIFILSVVLLLITNADPDDGRFFTKIILGCILASVVVFVIALFVGIISAIINSWLIALWIIAGILAIIAIYCGFPSLFCAIILGTGAITLIVNTSTDDNEISDDIETTLVISVSSTEKGDSLQITTEDSVSFVLPRSYSPISPGDEIIYLEDSVVSIKRQQKGDWVIGFLNGWMISRSIPK